MKRKIITRIAILSIPGAMALFHGFILAPYLFEFGNKTADMYAHVITLLIFCICVAAIAVVLED